MLKSFHVDSNFPNKKMDVHIYNFDHFKINILKYLLDLFYTYRKIL